MAEGKWNPYVFPPPARLEEEDPRRRIGAQAIGEDASRRPGADDDVVEAADIALGGIVHRVPPIAGEMPSTGLFHHEAAKARRRVLARCARRQILRVLRSFVVQNPFIAAGEGI